MLGRVAFLHRVSLTGLFGCWVALSINQHASAVDFERDVRPILSQRCSECHSTEEKNGGLSLTSAGALSAATDSGQPAIVPGEPEQSQLLVRVRAHSEDERMPPDGPRLSPEQIGLLSDWIAAGADWPPASGPAPATIPGRTDQASAANSQHWAFQPLASRQQLQQSVPALQDPIWAWSEIDRFIQAEREQRGLQVASDAAWNVLARRVAYTLTGLPPPLDLIADGEREVRASGDIRTAQRKLVDALLSSPAYGERWGRHWMDWVRYADTAGDNSDYPIPQAYLYRNYVIDAFNQDLPYDRFLTEQLAGDLLPASSLEQRNRQRIATGYLALARRFGSLVERYPWHLTIEDTIDNVGRTMLGLTLSCARCHDHKFDPISTRDYYGLYGIFASTRYPMPGLELFQAQQNFVPLIAEEQFARELAPHRAKLDQLTKELEQHLTQCEQRARENAGRQSQCSLDEQRRQNEELDAMLLKARRAGEALAKELKKLPDLPTAYAVQEAEPIDACIQIKGEPNRLGAQVPRKFPEVLGGQRLTDDVCSTSSGRLQLAQWITQPDNPLTARVIVNRIWQRHFGKGLVDSTTDFGLRGESPSHPELLDWLARELIENNWSLKHIQRLILNSHTYQLSSCDVDTNMASDPSNQWCWKMNRQRLDAESLRDTLLLLGGTLDAAPQTQPHPFPAMKEWQYTQHHPFKDEYASNKRSVYLMTKRLTAKPYFQTFDGPDPNVCTSDRDQSVTALQALYFVNDDFVHEQAENLATKIVATDATDTQRIEYAFRHILSRSPQPEEQQLIHRHLQTIKQSLQGADELAVWASLARSLLRLNEFLYVD